MTSVFFSPRKSTLYIKNYINDLILFCDTFIAFSYLALFTFLMVAYGKIHEKKNK